MRSQLSRASLRKLQLQRLKRLARSGRPAQKEVAVLIKVIHPFADVVYAPSDIFYVDAVDYMCWLQDWKSLNPLFVSWRSYLAGQLAAYRLPPAP